LIRTTQKQKKGVIIVMALTPFAVSIFVGIFYPIKLYTCAFEAWNRGYENSTYDKSIVFYG
jgi:hypothetical protein